MSTKLPVYEQFEIEIEKARKTVKNLGNDLLEARKCIEKPYENDPLIEIRRKALHEELVDTHHIIFDDLDIFLNMCVGIQETIDESTGQVP